jgi:glycosyltransferase involved in cell wall biosynthesis
MVRITSAGHAMMAPSRRVTIVYKTLPTYRRAFYNSLRESLAGVDIELSLIYGQATDHEATRRDTTDLQWGERVTNRFFRVGSRNLVWQPVLRRAHQADLVIVEQASKLLVNYALLLSQALGRTKVAFWGHGANLQGHTADPRGEAVKRLVSRYPHWWFAYTPGSRDRVVRLGYPSDRITVVQNAIDTRSLRAHRAAVSDEQIMRFRSEHDLGDGPVCAFVGSLYVEKRLSFLLEASDIIHRRLPGFRLIVIGDGPQRALIENASLTRTYIRNLGARFETDKVDALAAASLMLMPGAVGLVVLDSFALELPLVSTTVDDHGPEIEYVEGGVNGIIVQDAESATAYAEAVVKLLTNEVQLASLRNGCRVAAELYTNEEMVKRFTEGITRAIDADSRKKAI